MTLALPGAISRPLSEPLDAHAFFLAKTIRIYFMDTICKRQSAPRLAPA